MLVKFAVKNYRGFANKIEWDLSKPSNYSFNTFAVKDGVIKNGIIYGPNGSGKSNFALVIFDITNHLSQKWKKVNYYDNFAYLLISSKEILLPRCYVICIFINKQVDIYSLAKL